MKTVVDKKAFAIHVASRAVMLLSLIVLWFMDAPPVADWLHKSIAGIGPSPWMVMAAAFVSVVTVDVVFICNDRLPPGIGKRVPDTDNAEGMLR
jgi:hypothetical protein